MQISTNAGFYAPTNVSPISATQGAALSQVAETSGSGNFPPVEAVVNTTGSREIPSERLQPEIATPAGAYIYANPAQNKTVNNSPNDSPSDSPVETNNSQSNNDSNAASNDRVKNDEQADQQKQQAQEQQQQKQEQQNLAIIRELSQRDSEVRAHEQAHSSVGGQYAGSANYTYQRGPDGVSYAVGGEVSIDVSAVNGDPRATLEKMQTVLRAALAPAEPSTQDRQVAALASQQANQARAELANESRTAGQANTTEASRSETNSSETNSSILSKDFPLLSDRIAKINEIILAISQNDVSRATGQLLNDIA